MGFMGWVTSTIDADYTYYSLEHSSQQGAAGNRSFLADPDVDKLVEEGRSNTDSAARKDLRRSGSKIKRNQQQRSSLLQQYLSRRKQQGRELRGRPNRIPQAGSG